MNYLTSVKSTVFKKVSSQDYLLILRGRKCTEREKESVHGILFKYQLPEEVLNVILHYLISFKKLVPSDKTLEDYVKMLDRADIKTSEEGIMFFDKIEQDEHTARKRTDTSIFKGSTELVKVNGMLDETLLSFKKRCTLDQKKELTRVMNEMIRDAFRQSD